MTRVECYEGVLFLAQEKEAPGRSLHIRNGLFLPVKKKKRGRVLTLGRNAQEEGTRSLEPELIVVEPLP